MSTVTKFGAIPAQDPIVSTQTVPGSTSPKLTTGDRMRKAGLIYRPGKSYGQAKSVQGREAAPTFYESLLEQERQRQQQEGQALTDQLQKQAMGQTPSLAKAQLSAANQRNLAQTLAAAQGMGANPMMRRQLQQQTGQLQRQQAQQGQIAGLQEQATAQDLLAQQIASQQANQRALAQAGFNIARTPADLRAQEELDRFNAELQKWQAKKGAEAAGYGALIGTAGQILASDKAAKTDIAPAKKSVNSFLDELEKLSAPEADLGAVLKEQGKMHARLKKMEK